MLKQTLALGAALAAALAITAPAHATTYASGGLTAQSPSGLSGVVNFSAPSFGGVSVTVTDCCIVGDYYSAFLDGVLIGTTPVVPINGPTLSSATFLATLGAGTSHTFSVADQTSFQLPAGLSYDIESAAGGVPEPTAWALMLMGMFGLGGALRANRSGKFRTAAQVA